MAENSQHFGTREDTSTRHVNNVGILSMQEQLAELTSMVRQMAMKNVQQVKKYEICKDVSHPTDGCPMLQDDSTEQVNMVGHTPVPHRQYDSYSNTYNPGWRHHPNFNYGENKQNSIPNRHNHNTHQDPNPLHLIQTHLLRKWSRHWLLT